MKLNAAVNRMAGAKNNVQNGISFVEIQDGMLETVGRIVGRMAELKGMSTQDPLKSSQDVESYNNEFFDLQKQAMGSPMGKNSGAWAVQAGTAVSSRVRFTSDDSNSTRTSDPIRFCSTRRCCAASAVVGARKAA